MSSASRNPAGCWQNRSTLRPLPGLRRSATARDVSDRSNQSAGMVGEVLSGKRNEARQSGPRSFLPSAYDRAADAADTAGDVLARVDLDSCRSGERTLQRHTDKLGSWWESSYDAGVPPASAFAVASCDLLLRPTLYRLLSYPSWL